MSRASSLFLAGVVAVACAASVDGITAPTHAAYSLGIDSTHARIQRARLDTLAADLARYCKTNKAATYLCDDRASLDSARALEVYVAPLPDTTPTQPPPPPPPTGIVIQPGQSIQLAVDANPGNTTFLLKSGTHTRQTVVPKAGDVFRGEVGTVMDGQNATPFAFKAWNGSAWVPDVQLHNIVFANYTPPAQNGAIWIGNDRTNGAERWVLDSVEGRYNQNLAVRIGNHTKVLRSYLHHNTTINIGGVGIGVLIDGVESAYGNAGCPNNPGFESGGSKFAATDSLIVRNSFFHHNCGPALWLDINNIHYLLENNRVEDNAREGIVTEISYQGVIRNNQVRRNGFGDPFRSANWLWNAGIGVHASSDVEVYGNTVEDNFNGIVAIQQKRGAAYGDPAEQYGPYLVQNLYVHDNTVKQNTPQGAGLENAAAGIVQDVGDNAVFTARNNRFQHNSYTLIPPGTAGQSPGFEWMNGWRTPSQWRGYGQDVTGSFQP